MRRCSERSSTAASSPFGTDPVEVIRQGAPIPVNGVSMATVDGVERVTITFDAGLPGYRVAWVDAPIRCGSGETAEIDGAAWLEVRMTPAVAHTEEGKPLVGPIAIEPGTVVKDLEPTCDFEAEVTWIVGANRKVPFATRELLDPQRLEIDFKP